MRNLLKTTLWNTVFIVYNIYILGCVTIYAFAIVYRNTFGNLDAFVLSFAILIKREHFSNADE